MRFLILIGVKPCTAAALRVGYRMTTAVSPGSAAPVWSALLIGEQGPDLRTFPKFGRAGRKCGRGQSRPRSRRSLATWPVALTL